jgi:hypothetical protein
VRLIRAWRELTPERRLAVFAALLLFVSLFLPWYQESVIASGKATSIVSATESLTGWGAFSWVEAAVLLVSVGVIVLIFQRADGRAFHVPGGDGWAVTVAGGWTCFLIVYRMFDKQGTTEYRQYATTAGIEWGIFIALGVAVLLTVAGVRIRAANGPEPALPGERGRAFKKGADDDGGWRRRRSERTQNRGERTQNDEWTSGLERPPARRPARPATEPRAPRSGPDDEPPRPAGYGRDARPSERSSWRPAEKPEWSEPERETGWLSAQLRHEDSRTEEPFDGDE